MLAHPWRGAPVAIAGAGIAAALGACAGPAAKPAPTSAPGLLRVCSVPHGARIVLDGAPTPFRTPTTLPDLSPGPHRVLLTLAGHRNWSGSATVVGGATVDVTAALAPAAAGGLAITSIPAGAEVFVDGQARGATPLLLERVDVGTSTVQIRRDGYEPWSQAIVVLPDRNLAVEAALTPARGSLGHVALQSRPPGARIVLDGFPTGRTTPGTLHGLQAGVHRVQVLLEGHQAWSGTVTVREGRTEDLLVTLAAVREPGGAARVRSDPPGATIRVDGVLLRSRTPADLEGLAPGFHRVEIARPGSRAWNGTLRILPRETTELAVTLEPGER